MKTTPLRILTALFLALSGCGDAAESNDVSAASPTDVSVASSPTPNSSTGEGVTVTSTDQPREPTNLTPVPNAITPAPPPADDGSVEDPPREYDPGDPLVTYPNPKIPTGLEALVAAARANLAELLGVAESEIDVVLAESIVWPDASLGCPQPGMEYAQVQVEGWRTVLAHGGTSYAYHGGGSRLDPSLCRTPSFP